MKTRTLVFLFVTAVLSVIMSSCSSFFEPDIVMDWDGLDWQISFANGQAVDLIIKDNGTDYSMIVSSTFSFGYQKYPQLVQTSELSDNVVDTSFLGNTWLTCVGIRDQETIVVVNGEISVGPLVCVHVVDGRIVNPEEYLQSSG